MSKNLILPTTTFFQYGNTSKKKQAFSVWDFQKFRLTPILEGGFGISSLPENIGSGHPLQLDSSYVLRPKKKEEKERESNRRSERIRETSH